MEKPWQKLRSSSVTRPLNNGVSHDQTCGPAGPVYPRMRRPRLSPSPGSYRLVTATMGSRDVRRSRDRDCGKPGQPTRDVRPFQTQRILIGFLLCLVARSILDILVTAEPNTPACFYSADGSSNTTGFQNDTIDCCSSRLCKRNT